MKKSNIIILVVLFMIVGVGLSYYFGLFNNVLQTEFLPGTYIQSPTFYFFSCEPASEPVASPWQTVPSSGGWITCPSGTDTCDIELGLSQLPSGLLGNCPARVIYKRCDSSDVCGGSVTVETTNSNWQSLAKITNLRTDEKVYASFDSACVPFVWSDYSNGRERASYRPFILWKTDMFGGGKVEYTSVSQGCNFPSNVVGNLINTLFNSGKTITPQTSVSNTNLPFYKTRNFIGSYVPLSTNNINFVSYNGQNGYCLDRQIFGITTVNTNGGTYQIVDSNFNTRLASSVTCCPGETQPNQKCVQSGNSFYWQTIEQAECSYFSPCAGADWMVSSSKTLIRYNCVNSKCVAETKKVSCTYNSDCGSGEVCDTSSYTCVELQPGVITPEVNNTGNQSCMWYQEAYSSYSNDYGLFYWRALFGNPLQTPISGCRTAGWLYAVIFGIVIIILTSIVILLLRKPVKRRRKK